MKRLISVCAVLGGLMLGQAGRADADTISLTLDCDIVGSTCLSTAPVGTLTFSDSLVDSNWVDVTLNLNSGDVQKFLLNYAGFPLPSGYTFAAVGTSVVAGEDAQQAGGYSGGLFDLAIPEVGQISGNPFTTTLQLTNGSSFANLDASDFAMWNSNGSLWAAVLLTEGQGWFGAKTCSPDCAELPNPNPQTTVPEPASLALLGIAGAAAAFRRRRAASAE